ncbi:DUF3077 domain-containing protein [Microbulbifer sp. CAU 1566]|uniref:DUF3077 domain-containing protein n=1 Tax=Microbulbifer sp. CAU 1566 TaxID=2933269 RepID=UPI00200377AD|nr:DUF3077 domain-containing protein [Microbulbifer sp. CAU 1566]MCK7597787.1 DUF3077 domain-containing protein [Microbulbifer sp. CAU 1566]
MSNLVTSTRVSFYRFTPKIGSELYEIKDGLPIVDVLEHARNLVEVCEGIASNGEDGDLPIMQRYALQHLLPMAKATINSAFNALEIENLNGGAA